MKLARIAITIIAGILVACFIYTNVVYLKSIDLLSPIIDIESPEIVMSINDPIVQVFNGVTATDSKDGDVTKDMVIKNVSDFVENSKRTVNFIAFDSDGNYSEAQRSLVYSDYVSPKFDIKDSLSFPMGSSDQDILSKISAWDCLDGDVTNQIEFSEQSLVNSNQPGKYKIELNVTNSAGDTVSLPLTIEITNSLLANIAPKINLNKYLVYTELGTKINPEDYITNVEYKNQTYELTNEEGTFAVDTEGWGSYSLKEFRQRDPAVNKDLIKVTNYINYQVPGVYEVLYELEDLDGNIGSVILTVVVQDYE